MVEPAADVIDADPEQVALIQERARAHDPETFQRLFRVLLQRHQDLAWAPSAAQALEMAVARLATLPGTEPLARLVSKLDALDSGPTPEPSGGAPPPRGSRERPRSPAARGGSRGPGAGPRASAGGAARPRSAPKVTDVESEALGDPAQAPTNQTRGARDARVRQEAKEHPAVQQVIEVLDGELREIRGAGTRSTAQGAGASGKGGQDE